MLESVKVGDKLIEEGSTLGFSKKQYHRIVEVRRILKHWITVNSISDAEIRVRKSDGYMAGCGPYPTVHYRLPREGEIEQMHEERRKRVIIKQIKEALPNLETHHLFAIQDIIRMKQ